MSDLIQLVVLGAITYGAYRIISKLNNIEGKDFEAYRKRYPDLVKDGKVTCCNCGGNSIYIMRERPNSFLFHGIMVHTCRTCGCTLYFSKN
ncbi:hypothetical protein [Pasteurella sp. PK-2025]|uniref:hypothetical protein n=1 Tax=Pasteurella sp. PK-2025 TaxID=3413133 RepID=UPI003C76831A